MEHKELQAVLRKSVQGIASQNRSALVELLGEEDALIAAAAARLAGEMQIAEAGPALAGLLEQLQAGPAIVLRSPESWQDGWMEIRAQMSYTKARIDVGGLSMATVDVGDGDPIVFLAC